jgi:hypothetical protein
VRSNVRRSMRTGKGKDTGEEGEESEKERRKAM